MVKYANCGIEVISGQGKTTLTVYSEWYQGNGKTTLNCVIGIISDQDILRMFQDSLTPPYTCHDRAISNKHISRIGILMIVVLII